MSDHLHNEVLARRAEAEEARRQAAAQPQAAVEATATAAQAAHANAVTLADATARAEAIAVLRAQELEATTSNHGVMQAAALQTAQEDAARHRLGPFAIEDAFPADVVDGTIPDATNAQALHGGVAATTAPAIPTAPATLQAVATVTVAATPIGLLAQAVAVCAAPFGLGQGGFALSASEIRARDLANRFAEQERVVGIRKAEQRRRDEMRAKKKPARRP